jgi:hypothetical protein
MSLWNDEKYLRLLSSQLTRFSQKAPQHYNCRCPFCGDSAQSKIKARGYFFPSTNALIYKCHNCGLAIPFAAFLQRTSRALYDEYVMEVFRDQQPRSTEHAPTIPVPSKTLVVYDEMHQLSAKELPAHILPILHYVVERKLPSTAYSRLYGTVRAHTFLQPLVGEKAERVKDGLPYLVIPLRFANGEWYGAQFRLLTRKEYITFRWGHDALRAFGLNTMDSTKTVYVVEGPLDSLCLPNAIAMCGSDLLGGIQAVVDHQSGTALPDYVLVWDNEPRNPQIVKFLTTAVQQGRKVVIWPSDLPKDLNDMYASGLPVQSLVETHTYQGLRAELELQRWRK